MEVQFVAQISQHGYMSPRGQGGHTTCLMVGNGGNMGSDADSWEDEASPFLDRQTADGIRIVTGPGLGHIIKHAQVISSSSPRTGFKENVWEVAVEFL